MGEQLFYYHPDHLGSTGYVTRENGKVHEHIQYFPFGETWVQQGGNTEKSPYLFTSKELDEETGLYYFGARYYDPRTSVWQSTDPILAKYLDNSANNSVFQPEVLGLYSYVHHKPLRLVDPDGRDAIPIAFPDYKISAFGTKWSGLGHAGIVLIDPKTGSTRYYEYGRYDKAERGIVRRQSVPDVVMDKKTGKPTDASMKKLMGDVSKKTGHGTRVEGAYVKDGNFQKMVDYADKRMEQNSDEKRESYSISGNNCATFSRDVLDAGGVDTPMMIDPRPNSYIEELQSDFGNRVGYNPSDKKLEMKAYE